MKKPERRNSPHPSQPPAFSARKSSGSSSLASSPGKHQIIAKKGFVIARHITSELVLLVYAKTFQVGVLLHLPPLHQQSADRVERKRRAFAESAIAMILSEFESLGVLQKDLTTYVVGGSSSDSDERASKILIQKFLWKYGVSLTACDVGGEQIRSVWMDVANGRTIIRSQTSPNVPTRTESPLPVAS